jgi:DNA-binding transcriptional ArsR family regulator
MAVPKWTDERTDELTNFVGGESPISQATVASAAEHLETSPRSVSSKLRKMGFDVELASNVSTKTFSDEEEATLQSFVEGNSGQYTYAEIAEAFAGGTYSAKSIQGKILSMELTSHVKPTEKPASVRTYSPDEEATFLGMVADGAFVEDIAAALNRPINSIRGKALSFLRTGEIGAIPKQKESNAASKVDALAELGDISEMNVSDIADSIGKTERGVKTMLTRRGLTAADYDGAARKERVAN